jgi:hypothetical protein
MERTVIVDHRTYTIKPSGIRGWLSLYHEKGWPRRTVEPVFSAMSSRECLAE